MGRSLCLFPRQCKQKVDYSLGLTLWIIPPPHEREVLQNVMSARPNPGRTATHSPSSYPVFVPHITLAILGPKNTTDSNDSSPLNGLRPSIPPAQKRFRVRFRELSVGDHYFRSVYVKIELSSELEVLHEEVHRRLGVRPRTPVFPHMSLVYITDEDAQGDGEGRGEGQREKYKNVLEERGMVRDFEGNLALKVREEQGEWISGFEIEEIWIVRCDGPVEGWVVEDKIVLGA